MINYYEIKNETMDDLLNSKILLARDVLELKANLSGFIKQIFMVFHGIFSRDFTGSIEDKKIFEETYPYLSKLAKKEIGKDYISKIIEFLSKARDKFMHGVSYMNFDDAEMVKIVSKIYNYSSDCSYVKNNKITYAGFFAFLCCFSNDKMINYYLKSSRVNHKPHFTIKLVDKNAFTTDEYSSLTADAVGMKDEILIRKPENTSDVITAIFGKFMEVLCEDKNNNFSYDSGIRDDVCDFFISGSYKNNILIINKNSLFLDYFEKDYKLEIKDENTFISLCEQVPPFYLVAHLKKMGITEFDSNTLSKSDIDFILKYNKPKYYVDKNINTIFYPKSEADVRFVGQIISSTLLYMFINFEETVYGYFQLDSSEGYSKISKALRHIGISGELFKSLVAIRNFFAHQYIIGDYIYAFDKFYKVTIKFVFKTLEDFINKLKVKDEHLYKMVSGDFTHRLVTQLIYFKYADIIRASSDFLEREFDFELAKKLQMKELRQASSIITTDIENIISNVMGEHSIKFNQQEVKYIIKTSFNYKGTQINLFTIGKPNLSKSFPGAKFNCVNEIRDGFVFIRELEIEE